MKVCFCDFCKEPIHQSEFKVKDGDNYILFEDLKYNFAVKYEVITITCGNMSSLCQDLCIACVRKIFATGKLAHITKKDDDISCIIPMEGYNKIKN